MEVRKPTITYHSGKFNWTNSEYKSHAVKDDKAVCGALKRYSDPRSLVAPTHTLKWSAPLPGLPSCARCRVRMGYAK